MAMKHVHNTNQMIVMMWMLITKVKEIEDSINGLRDCLDTYTRKFHCKEKYLSS